MQIDNDGVWLNHTKPNLCPRLDRSFLGGRLIISWWEPPGDIPLKGDFHEGQRDLGSANAEEIESQDCSEKQKNEKIIKLKVMTTMMRCQSDFSRGWWVDGGCPVVFTWVPGGGQSSFH